MKKLTSKTTDFLILKFLKTNKDENITSPDARKKIGYLEAIISIIINLFLAIIKGFFGLMINSIALLADAVHTASDVLTSLVVIMGFKLSAMPADDKHPHGHGRIEFLTTLFISMLLIYIGVQFAINSYERFVENTVVAGSYLVIAIMIFAALLKEWLAQLSVNLGERIKSTTLIADAWHHRTDAIASIMVAIAILASQFGYYRVDAILGFAVSLLIIYTGLVILNESISKIIGETDHEEIEEIEKLAMSIEGVKNTHDILMHDYGAHKNYSLHIELDKNLTVEQAHQIADKVENLIESKKESKVIVHVDAHKKVDTN
ncbi:Cobalt-zinc-cadmium resistance protein [Candidatus Syntrophocurvum alkaliphilum]|uniref:Cobalt-zinc-cadmium resistance protein n=1 Tax=Candidatus Syntrophocurvum alkaliphilum TaxID=2293317 RepID=A0A6I6DJM7_9FIRM|nr:cation diffusion facilitator family transporter [Candidatus Syntrophocurvum alkaliphilum]QGT99601.1 Cobalt-zinc-cadmium resistance protein [Candidatus Syntrophocurvum alkaliphilum]